MPSPQFDHPEQVKLYQAWINMARFNGVQVRYITDLIREAWKAGIRYNEATKWVSPSEAQGMNKPRGIRSWNELIRKAPNKCHEVVSNMVENLITNTENQFDFKWK